MGFFDLNIPYDSAASDKAAGGANRLKLVVKAMELGYGGIAYNRTIKGVMSDHDRCSIPLLSLSSLLKVAPSLSRSVSLHRDLLGVPRSSPFRQFTRLTVCADSVSQAQALNSANPVLKTYDLVAVRPLTQTAFDYACEKSEMDIISIDFSEKPLFRLKPQMVKAAISRGVHFEITYSRFVAGIQERMQMIKNVEKLVHQTRGKNLIVSSGASCVNEIRGPYDVANLLSRLGITMERAKPSISRNCRTLIANALRKRQFYKETIKVEAVPAKEKPGSDDLWSLDMDDWDPISSGSGDLRLENADNSISASKNVSNNIGSIDFVSVMETIPSGGFQVKDLVVPETVAASQTRIEEQKTSTNEVLVMETVEDDDGEELVQTKVTRKEECIIELLSPSKIIANKDDQVYTESTRDEVPILNDTDVPGKSDQSHLSGLTPGKLVLFGDVSDISLLHKSPQNDTVMWDVDLPSMADDINLTVCQINEEYRDPDSLMQICEESNREDVCLCLETDGESPKSEDFCREDNRTALVLEASLLKGAISSIACDAASLGRATDQTDTASLADRLPEMPHDNMKHTSGIMPLSKDDLSNCQMKISTDSSPTSDEQPIKVGRGLGNQMHIETAAAGASDLLPSLPYAGGRAKTRRYTAVPIPLKRLLRPPIMKKHGRKGRRNF